MYSQRLVFYPIMGKGPELRDLIAGRARQRNASGIRSNVSVQAFGVDGPAMSLLTQFADLAALESFRKDQAANPDPAYLAKVSSLSRQPLRAELWEGIVTPPPGTPPPAYIQRVVYTQGVGKARELLDVLTGMATRRNAEGAPVALSVQAAGPAQGTVQMVILLDSLTALEKRRANPAPVDPQRAAQLTAAMGERATSELWEIIVPFPA